MLEDPLNNNMLRNGIIDNLISNKLITELICDQFGNYVIQKALMMSDGMRFLGIIHEIKGCIKTLKQTVHGKKIYENLITNYGDYLQPTKNIKYKNANDGRRKSQMNNNILFHLSNRLDK